MFVTTTAFEHSVPGELREADSRYWLALQLSGETPFFLVSFRQEADGFTLLQTVAVAWETTLVTVAQSASDKAMISVSRLAPDPAREGAWVLREIAELWLPSEKEADETGPLVFRFVGERGLRDSLEAAASETQPGRRLLFRSSSP